ncbi:MAG: DinB family protein [Bacteroidota bacterium]
MSAHLNPYFERQYAYSRWANQQVIDLLKTTTLTEDREILVELSHEIAAFEIWISRIQGRAPRVGGVWEIYDLARCEALNNEVLADWLAYIPTMKHEDYFRIIAYKNTKGDYYETPVIDIMGHAPTHGNYHRARIAVLIRAKGFIPVNTDFITYARNFALNFQA